MGRVDPRGYGARGELIARLARPRNRELFTLVLVGLLTAAGFGAVFAARENEVSTASLSYAAFFFALYLVAHMVLRLTLPDADPSLLPLVATLTAIGEIEIYRIDPELARDQGLWIAIGVALFAGVCAIGRDLRRLESLRYTCGVTALVLLAATLVVGAEVNGARLWIRIGGYQIQPGEFAKVLLVVFLAGYLRDHREVLERPSRTFLRIGIPALRHTLPLLLMSGAALVLLVRMNDLGSSFLLYGTVIAMVYVATGRWLYVAFGVALFALGAWLAAQVAPRSTSACRRGSTPGKTSTTTASRSCSRCTRSPTAASSAPPYGRGFVVTDSGNTVIPYAQTDFIYSVIATETGFAGAAGLILLYVLFAWRGLKIAAVAGDGFSKLLAVGLTFAFCFQAFVIIGGVTKLVPLTGLTLPFVFLPAARR